MLKGSWNEFNAVKKLIKKTFPIVQKYEGSIEAVSNSKNGQYTIKGDNQGNVKIVNNIGEII